ncbi:MAG: isocitrate/isopropylmalate dehydrogenase family protein [Myxococcota bacterium]
MKYTVTLIPGDGIGPEVTAAVVRVIEAVCPSIAWESVVAGEGAMAEHGKPLPEQVLTSVRKNRIALKGPIGTPIGKGFTSVNVGLRKALDLYVSLRPVDSLPGLKTRHDGVDLVVFRENTEGLYAGIEHEPVPGVIESLRISTEAAWRRFVKHAYEWCRYNGRRKIHLVHKGAIMKLSEGIFLDVAREIASDYPYLETLEIPVDQLFMDLVLDPTRFDVLITDNLFGDLVSDLTAGLVGGLGVVPGANIGDKYAVFEAVHGTAPDIAGKGLANPIALLRSGAMMLDHIGERQAAARVERAVKRVLEQGVVRTGDLGGKSTTAELTDAIIAAL